MNFKRAKVSTSQDHDLQEWHKLLVMVVKRKVVVGANSGYHNEASMTMAMGDIEEEKKEQRKIFGVDMWELSCKN